MATSKATWDGGLGIPGPLHAESTADGNRILGTTLDYTELRALELAEGRPFAMLGEAVLGSAVAAGLDAGVCGTILSHPENPFDLDGASPLEMSVAGVLTLAEVVLVLPPPLRRRRPDSRKARGLHRHPRRRDDGPAG